MGDGAEGQGLLGDRSFPFWGLVGAEVASPPRPRSAALIQLGIKGRGRERVHSLARDLDFNFVLL